MEEWTQLGISRRTYFRHLADGTLKVPNGTLGTNFGTKLVFDGTNGNKVSNITKEEMDTVLENNPAAFRPNWYTGGFDSRN